MSEITEPSTLTGQPSGGRGGPNGTVRALRQGLGTFARQREATVLVVTVALLLYFGITSRSSFISSINAANLLSAIAAPIIIIAIGEVFLLICGEIDLSVGFIYTFAPMVTYMLITYYHVPVILAVICCLLTGLVAGWVNGFITVTLGVPSFITTLGTGLILSGLALTVSHDVPLIPPANTAGIGKWIGGSQGAGLQQWTMFIWAVVLVAILHVVLTRTRWGLHTVAVGGNRLGAREAGINAGRIRYAAFMLTGVMGALVGIQVGFYNNSFDPLAGGYTPMFTSVTAAVIGGTALVGGSGTILGAFLGSIALATVQDGFDVVGLSANPLPIITGCAILVAMVANVTLERLRATGRSGIAATLARRRRGELTRRSG